MKGVLLIDDILPTGSYVGENLTRPPLAGEALPVDVDVLKMLEQEYIRYLSEGEIAGIPTRESQPVAVIHRQSELQPLDVGQTITEHLLGHGRMIDKLFALPELVQEADDLLFEPSQQPLLFRLSPLDLTINNTRPCLRTLTDKLFLFPGDEQ